MSERVIDDLHATCSKCHYEWSVYAGVVIYPYEKYTICPKCGYENHIIWHDSETKKKLEQKKLGLSAQSKIDPRIDVLEKKVEAIDAKREADHKDIEMLRTLLDLEIRQSIQDLKGKWGDHNFNMNALQEQINKVNEKFDKIIEWQAKNGRQSPEAGN